jgi:hypothetical protein
MAEDDPSTPPLVDPVRDLTAEQYAATYASGTGGHRLPAAVLRQLSDRGGTGPASAPGDLTLPFLRARSYGGAFRLPARIRVIHSTEGPMSRGNARILAGPAWFGGPAGTSAHDIFDPGEGIKMVPDGNVAYHVGPNGNGFTRGSEHCGRVALTREQWLSAEGRSMLERSARYNAAAARRDGVRPRWLSLTQLARRESGFCTHNDIRLALGGTTHSDPGPNFPYDWYMARVRAHYDSTAEDAEMAQYASQLDEILRRVKHIETMVPTASNQSAARDNQIRAAVADAVTTILAALRELPAGRLDPDDIQALATEIAALLPGVDPAQVETELRA